MGFSCRLFGGDELHAQFVGAQSDLAQDPFAVSLFVILGSRGQVLPLAPNPPSTASAAAINRLMRDTESCNSLAIAVNVMPHSRYAMRSASGRSAVRCRRSCNVLTKRLKHSIKTALSARHVPNDIFQVSAIPRTLSGKKMELPVKKLLMGTPAAQVFNVDAMTGADNAAECVAWFVAFAQSRRPA